MENKLLIKIKILSALALAKQKKGFFHYIHKIQARHGGIYKYICLIHALYLQYMP